MDKKLNLLSDTLLVGLVTLVGYLCTCAFQYGYLTNFKIPIYLIEINLNQVLFASLTIVIVLAFMVPVIDLYLQIDFNKNKYPLFEKISFLVVYLSLTIVPLIVLSNDPSDPYNKIKIIALILLVLFFFFLLLNRYYRNIKNNIEIEKIEKKGLIERFQSIYGTFPALGIFLGFMVIIYSFYFGSYESKNQDTFLVTSNDPQSVIVATYSDDLIAIELDKTTNNLTRKISIISKDNLHAQEIKTGYLSNKNYADDKTNQAIDAMVSKFNFLRQSIGL